MKVAKSVGGQVQGIGGGKRLGVLFTFKLPESLS